MQLQEIIAVSAQLEDQKILDVLRRKQFDFGILELFWYCGYAVFHKIGLRNYASAIASDLVEVLSDNLGVSNPPSYVPSKFMLLMKV